jgi:hypothetical protein
MRIFVVLLFIGAFTDAYTQSKQGKFDLRLGLSTYPTINITSYGKDRKYNRHYEVLASYQFAPYMSSGLYMGYMFRDVTTTTFEYMCYGVNSGVHIMPLLFPGKNARLDLYAKGQLGVAEILEYEYLHTSPGLPAQCRGNFLSLQVLGGISGRWTEKTLL